MRDYFLEYMKHELEEAGVDIHKPGFIYDDAFKAFENAYVHAGFNGHISYREMIERYLLSDEERTTLYDSKYEMGNTVVLEKVDCTYEALAEELTDMFHNDRTVVASEFTRNGGLRSRIKSSLGIDFSKYYDGKGKKHTEAELKILYLFYYMENCRDEKRNVLKMLANPSIENVDNTAVGIETSNGRIMKELKDSVGREISVEFRGKVKRALSQMALDWQHVIQSASMVMDYADEYGYADNLDPLIAKYNKVADTFSIKDVPDKYVHSLYELLYLKLAQHENQGREKDIHFVNSIPIVHLERSAEQIEILLHLRRMIVERCRVAEYIETYAEELAELVYLKNECTKGEIQRIYRCANKAEMILGFFAEETMLLNMTRDKVNVAFIVACLQAIILSEQTEEFKYKFPAYDKVSRTYKRVQGALKGEDKIVYEALKAYFVRKVLECMNCNYGRKKTKDRLTQIENMCDMLFYKILAIPDLDAMVLVHDYYVKAICQEIIEFPQRQDALMCFRKMIEEHGYEYVDIDNIVGNVFYESAIMYSNLNEIAERLIYRIHNPDDENDLVSFDFEVCDMSEENVLKNVRIEFLVEYDRHVITAYAMRRDYSLEMISRLNSVGISLN